MIPFPESARWSVTTSVVPATSDVDSTTTYSVNYEKSMDVVVALNQSQAQKDSSVTSVGGSGGYDPSAAEGIDQLDSTVELLESLKYAFMDRKQAHSQPSKQKQSIHRLNVNDTEGGETADNPSLLSKTKEVEDEEEDGSDNDVGQYELSDLLSNISKVMKKHTAASKKRQLQGRGESDGIQSVDKFKKKKKSTELRQLADTSANSKRSTYDLKRKSPHDSSADVNRQKNAIKNVCSIQNLAAAIASRNK